MALSRPSGNMGQTYKDTTELQLQNLKANTIARLINGKRFSILTTDSGSGLLLPNGNFANELASAVKNFDTLADAIADPGLVGGDTVNLKERSTGNGGGATGDIVSSLTVTVNGFGIVGHNTLALAFVLRSDDVELVDKYGDTPGDATTDVTAIIQAALNTNKNVIFTHLKSYKFDSTLFFANGQDINVNGAKLFGAAATTLFQSGFHNGAEILSNFSAPEDAFTQVHTQTKIYGGKIFDAGKCFDVYKMLSGSLISDFECFDVDQILITRWCFFSSYERLYYRETVASGSFFSTNANITQGNATVTVVDATGIIVGQKALSHAFDGGILTVTVVAGTSITFDRVADLTVAAGSNKSGMSFAVNAKPVFDFSNAVSQVYASRLSVGSRWVAFSIADTATSVFDLCDAETSVIGFDLIRGVQADFRSSHLEGIRYTAFDGTQLTTSDISISRTLIGNVNGSAALIVDNGVGVLNATIHNDYFYIGGLTPFGQDDTNAKALLLVTGPESSVELIITAPPASLEFTNSLESSTGLRITSRSNGTTRTNWQNRAAPTTLNEISYRFSDTISPSTLSYNKEVLPASGPDVIAAGMECANAEFFTHIPDRSAYVRLMNNFISGSVREPSVVFGLSDPQSDGVTSEAADIWIIDPNASRPAVDNDLTLGNATFRLSEIFAVNATINTSDRTLKTEILTVSEKEKAVGLKLKSLLCKFKWIDSVELKGEGARIHFGIIAQDVDEAFASVGLDANDYALFCRDEWYEIDGKVVNPDLEGNYPEGAELISRLGVRMSQIHSLILASI
jgi:hypothetical protein